MSKLSVIFGVLFLLGGACSANAMDCAATYDPVSYALHVPCVTLTTEETQAFSVDLAWAGSGYNFTLANAVGLSIGNPVVESVTILSSPLPLVIVRGSHSNGCWNTYGSPTVTWTGNHIDIHLKAYAVQNPDFACTQAFVSFVEAVSLPVAESAVQTLTYSVNGTAVTPTFGNL